MIRRPINMHYHRISQANPGRSPVLPDGCGLIQIPIYLAVPYFNHLSHKHAIYQSFVRVIESGL